MLKEPVNFSLSALTIATLAAVSAIHAEMVLKWSDEFEYAGAPDPGKWTHEIGGGGWGNQELQTYTDSLENSRVEDGKLIIEVQQVLGNRSPQYTSARLISREKGQWKYGRVEVRAKVPSETGTWAAVWMLPADTLWSTTFWPDNGEIDILEHVGYEEDPLFKALKNDPQLPNLHSTLHTEKNNGWSGGGIGGSAYWPDASTAFHTYALNWTEEGMTFEVDGVVHFSIDRPTFREPPPDPWQYWPFDQRFFLVLNVAIGGGWGGHFNSTYYPNDSPYGFSGIDHDGVWPQRMEIEYIRVYGTDEPPMATSAPGTLLPTDMDDDTGVLIELSQNPESSHSLKNIDAGDRMDFVVTAPIAGGYSVSTSAAAPDGGSTVTIEALESGSSSSPKAVPAPGGWQAWQPLDLGTVQLQQGTNTLRISTETGGFNLAALTVELETATNWKGWTPDLSGNVDTQSWLGEVNITHAPWIYLYSPGKYAYMPSATIPESLPEDAWIYFPR